MAGPTREVIVSCMRALSDRAGSPSRLPDVRRPQPQLAREVELVHAELAGHSGGVFEADAPISFDLGVRANAAVPEFRLSFTIHSYEGQAVGNAFSSPQPGLKT